VHLSNALLLGLAETIKKRLKIPVVCSLQDEDVWVDVMRPYYRDKTWKLMAEKAADVDAFVSVSDYFATIMKKNLNLPDHKIQTVHIGVNPLNYNLFKPETEVPVIGYLSRLCEENGLEILIDAFIELKNNSSYKNAKLRLTGGKTGDDKRFISKQIRKLKWNNYLNDVEFIEDFSPASLDNFFNGLTVLSVPVLKGEAFGLYQIESLASGIPVVQPALGAFPEIVNSSGGGVIYSPNTSTALSNALSTLFSDPSKIKKLSLDGRNSVSNKFNIEKLSRKMIDVYESVLTNTK
jgi:glycosyltransferase involved in cell wall biosynthesis